MGSNMNWGVVQSAVDAVSLLWGLGTTPGLFGCQISHLLNEAFGPASLPKSLWFYKCDSVSGLCSVDYPQSSDNFMATPFHTQEKLHDFKQFLICVCQRSEGV